MYQIQGYAKLNGAMFFLWITFKDWPGFGREKYLMKYPPWN